MPRAGKKSEEGTQTVGKGFKTEDTVDASEEFFDPENANGQRGEENSGPVAPSDSEIEEEEVFEDAVDQIDLAPEIEEEVFEDAVDQIDLAPAIEEEEVFEDAVDPVEIVIKDVCENYRKKCAEIDKEVIELEKKLSEIVSTRSEGSKTLTEAVSTKAYNMVRAMLGTVFILGGAQEPEVAPKVDPDKIQIIIERIHELRRSIPTIEDMYKEVVSRCDKEDLDNADIILKLKQETDGITHEDSVDSIDTRNLERLQMEALKQGVEGNKELSPELRRAILGIHSVMKIAPEFLITRYRQEADSQSNLAAIVRMAASDVRGFLGNVFAASGLLKTLVDIGEEGVNSEIVTKLSQEPTISQVLLIQKNSWQLLLQENPDVIIEMIKGVLNPPPAEPEEKIEYHPDAQGPIAPEFEEKIAPPDYSSLITNAIIFQSENLIKLLTLLDADLQVILHDKDLSAMLEEKTGLTGKDVTTLLPTVFDLVRSIAKTENKEVLQSVLKDALTTPMDIAKIIPQVFSLMNDQLIQKLASLDPAIFEIPIIMDKIPISAADQESPNISTEFAKRLAKLEPALKLMRTGLQRFSQEDIGKIINMPQAEPKTMVEDVFSLLKKSNLAWDLGPEVGNILALVAPEFSSSLHKTIGNLLQNFGEEIATDVEGVKVQLAGPISKMMTDKKLDYENLATILKSGVVKKLVEKTQVFIEQDQGFEDWSNDLCANSPTLCKFNVHGKDLLELLQNEKLLDMAVAYIEGKTLQLAKIAIKDPKVMGVVMGAVWTAIKQALLPDFVKRLLIGSEVNAEFQNIEKNGEKNVDLARALKFDEPGYVLERFSGARNYSGLNIESMNFDKLNIEIFDFRNVNFRGKKEEELSFEGSHITGCNFAGATTTAKAINLTNVTIDAETLLTMKALFKGKELQAEGLKIIVPKDKSREERASLMDDIQKIFNGSKTKLPIEMSMAEPGQKQPDAFIVKALGKQLLATEGAELGVDIVVPQGEGLSVVRNSEPNKTLNNS